MARFYNSIDVICVASTAEGDPLPLVEGMACGCFPVCVDVGIVPELVQSGVNGLIVDRTPAAFRAALSGAHRISTTCARWVVTMLRICSARGPGRRSVSNGARSCAMRIAEQPAEWPSISRSQPIIFVLTVDTEADNQWSHGVPLTTENVRYWEPFQHVCRKTASPRPISSLRRSRPIHAHKHFFVSGPEPAKRRWAPTFTPGPHRRSRSSGLRFNDPSRRVHE